jgi:hypothetical protein
MILRYPRSEGPAAGFGPVVTRVGMAGGLIFCGRSPLADLAVTGHRDNVYVKVA